MVLADVKLTLRAAVGCGAPQTACGPLAQPIPFEDNFISEGALAVVRPALPSRRFLVCSSRHWEGPAPTQVAHSERWSEARIRRGNSRIFRVSRGPSGPSL